MDDKVINAEELLGLNTFFWRTSETECCQMRNFVRHGA